MRARHQLFAVLTILLLASFSVQGQESTGPFVYVTTFDGNLYKVDVATHAKTIIFSNTGARMEDAAVGPDGNVYICVSLDNYIFRVDSNGFNYEVVYSKGENPSDPEGPEGISFDSLANAFFNTRGSPSTHTGLWELPDLGRVPTGGTMPTPVNVVGPFSDFGEGTTTKTANGDLLLVDSDAPGESTEGRVMKTPHNFSTLTTFISGLSNPNGIATRSNGDVLVMQENGEVFLYNSSGEPLGDGPLFTLPLAGSSLGGFYLDVDAEDNVYAALYDTNTEIEGSNPGGLYKFDGESLTRIADIASAVGVAIGTSSVSETHGFSPTQTSQTFHLGPSTVTVSFPSGVITPFDFTLSREQKMPQDVEANLAANFPASTCIREATDGGNCAVMDVTGPIPLKGVHFRGRANLQWAFSTIDQILHYGFMHDSSQVPGADFTSDIERFFFLEPASGDPIGDGTTDNFQRFVLVNQPFSHLHYPCNIEPSQAGTQTFTLGSVIRLRFQLTNNSNCSGGFEAGAQAELSVVRKTADGPVFQPVKSGSNTANIFSYNFNNNRYVYQLKTNGYAPGPHCATVVFHTFDAGALPFTTCFNIVP